MNLSGVEAVLKLHSPSAGPDQDEARQITKKTTLEEEPSYLETVEKLHT